jgi:hypothetical protein
MSKNTVLSVVFAASTLAACSNFAPLEGITAGTDLETGPETQTLSTKTLSTKTLSTQANAGKKLIFVDGGATSLEDFKTYSAAIDASPFDGIAVRYSSGTTVLNRQPYSQADFVRHTATANGITSKKLKQSYARMDMGSAAGWDWFNASDWAATDRNVHLFAKLASSVLNGIALDQEPYEKNPWEYSAQPGAASHSFAQYQAQVRLRGAQFMNALQGEYPNVTVFCFKLFTANSFILALNPSDAQLPGILKADGAGLWPSFVNGMLAVAGPKVKFVEGNENAYDYSKASEFDAGRTATQRIAARLLEPGNRAKYAAQVQVSQAIYVDGVMNFGQSPNTLGYYFKSDAERLALLEHNTYHAVRGSDSFAWEYIEKNNWWTSAPKNVVAAMASGKQKILADKPLGFDVSASVNAAKVAFNSRVTLGGKLTAASGSVPRVKFLINGQPDTGICGAYNDNKEYGCVVPAGTSLSITPVVAGRVFAPPSRSYLKVTKTSYSEDYALK